MRELDSILLAFVDRYLARMTDAEMTAFERVLELPDPVLQAYLLGRSAPDDDAIAELIERIRACANSES
jgi:succinate dehydrogenase flavin-adding protein (antitoxin of CptAB toxin-antitoxin module)